MLIKRVEMMNELQLVFIMKLMVIFAVCVALSFGAVVPKDNSHYVEGESRYVWLSRDSDNLELVDLQERAEPNPRSGANNQYWLFTRQNPINRQILADGDYISVANSNFRTDRPINVVIHGWTNSGNDDFSIVVRDSFISDQDSNVIVVDWSDAAAGSYITAVSNVVSVGQFLGNFLTWLVNATGINWNQVHVVGYSLGAHVAGVAGRQAGGRAARVTGLDPAGPLWHTSANRLSSNAGQYVEGIHTNGYIQGIMTPVGHADFYPNGGRDQPGCNGSGCDHARAYQFFASSVRTNHLLGRLCADFNQALNIQCWGTVFPLGNGIVSKQGFGLYGLTTTASWPY